MIWYFLSFLLLVLCVNQFLKFQNGTWQVKKKQNKKHKLIRKEI